MFKVDSMVHTPEAGNARAITLEVSHEPSTYNDPHMTMNGGTHGASATLYFRTIEQLQAFVNEGRKLLDEWLVEEMHDADTDDLK
tara:strand:+ start:87 stop:341 length:255 start_codon:yes stop_codon:yes gene_type:complete